MFNTVLTTANKYEGNQTTSGGIIDTSKLAGTLKDYQTVVAIGPMVHNVSVGDTVLIDLTAYGKPKYEKDKNRQNSVGEMVDSYKVDMTYEVPQIIVNGEELLNIKDRDIAFVAEIEEEEPSIIEVVSPKIILT